MLAPSRGCTCAPPNPPFDREMSLGCPVHGDEAAALVIQHADAGTLIQAQPPGLCEFCAAIAETRPYGPRGEEICFPCAMKDEDSAKRQFMARMGGA